MNEVILVVALLVLAGAVVVATHLWINRQTRLLREKHDSILENLKKINDQIDNINISLKGDKP